MDTFRSELSGVLNKYNKENGSNTPDFVLTEYLIKCLHAFDAAISKKIGCKNNEELVDKINKLDIDVSMPMTIKRTTPDVTDTSVSPKQTLFKLRGLLGEIDVMVDALEMDIGRDDIE